MASLKDLKEQGHTPTLLMPFAYIVLRPFGGLIALYLFYSTAVLLVTIMAGRYTEGFNAGGKI